jgi:hypothetical protein
MISPSFVPPAAIRRLLDLTDICSMSGRDMMAALVAGERNPRCWLNWPGGWPEPSAARPWRRGRAELPVESPTASPGASIRENCDSEEEEEEEEEEIFGGMTVPARMTVG